MKKQALIYWGLLAGLINTIFWFISHSLFQSEIFDFSKAEILGYTAMLLALSTVFFGVKRYRDTVLGGKISFGQAFLNGMIVVLVASAIYVIGWEIYYPNFAADFGDKYYEYLINGYKEAGLSTQEIKVKTDEMAIWMDRYQYPIYRIPLTLMEILPLGILVAAVTGLVLKKK